MALPDARDGANWRPAFTRNFPSERALDDLVRAFAAGDFGTVRRGASLLAASTLDPEVRVAANVLRARIAPDPAIVWLLVLTAIALVGLAGYWVSVRGASLHLDVTGVAH